MFVQAFSRFIIPEHRFRTRGTLKKMICLSISQGLFLLFCNFHMNLNMQNSWPHWLSTYSCHFIPAITFMWGYLQIPWWPWFFQQQLYLSVPCLFDFKFLCANWLSQSFHTYCFRIFDVPVVWSILEIPVLSQPLLVSIVQSFLKASSLSSRVHVQFRSLNPGLWEDDSADVLAQVVKPSCALQLAFVFYQQQHLSSLAWLRQVLAVHFSKLLSFHYLFCSWWYMPPICTQQETGNLNGIDWETATSDSDKGRMRRRPRCRYTQIMILAKKLDSPPLPVPAV